MIEFKKNHCVINLKILKKLSDLQIELAPSFYRENKSIPQYKQIISTPVKGNEIDVNEDNIIVEEEEI